MDKEWKPVILDPESVTTDCGNAIHRLATGDVPAIIVRRAYPEEACQKLLDRLFERQLFEGFEEFGRSNMESSIIERLTSGQASVTYLVNHKLSLNIRPTQTPCMKRYLMGSLIRYKCFTTG